MAPPKRDLRKAPKMGKELKKGGKVPDKWWAPTETALAPLNARRTHRRGKKVHRRKSRPQKGAPGQKKSALWGKKAHLNPKGRLGKINWEKRVTHPKFCGPPKKFKKGRQKMTPLGREGIKVNTGEHSPSRAQKNLKGPKIRRGIAPK